MGGMRGKTQPITANPAVISAHQGADLDHADTGGVGGQFQGDAGSRDLVDRADVDFEAHHLGLEIVLVAVLGGDEEAVVSVRQRCGLEQDLAGIVGIEAQTDGHGPLVEAALLFHHAAAADGIEGHEGIFPAKLAQISDLANERHRQGVVAGSVKGSGRGSRHFQRRARGGANRHVDILLGSGARLGVVQTVSRNETRRSWVWMKMPVSGSVKSGPAASVWTTTYSMPGTVGIWSAVAARAALISALAAG